MKSKVVLLKSQYPTPSGRKQPGSTMGSRVRKVIQRSIKATLR
jgi:hypothetical protein